MFDLPLLLALTFVPSLSLSLEPTGSGATGIDDWISVDDPDLSRLPVALRLLPHEEQVVYESAKKPWFLIARRVRLESDAVAAFAADESVMAKRGEYEDAQQRSSREAGDST